MNDYLNQETLIVLIVEDNPGDIRLVRELLNETEPGQFRVIWADSIGQAIDCLLKSPVDIVLLDLSLPDVSGLETLKQMQSAAGNLPIVVLSGNSNEALALQAVRDGAQDYILKKNLDIHLLARVIRYAIERKHYEVALRHALDKEKDLHELKSRIVSMVSHDFRTPLMTIQSSSDLLCNYHDRITEEQRTQYFASINTQVKHLTFLLEDMLALTKADSVGTAFNPTLIDLRAACQGLVDEMQQLAGTRSINFVASGPFESVEIDTNLLRRALLNLLSNAVKYSPEGSVIDFTLIRSAEEIVIRIQDHGIGIPEEEKSQMFEVFHRANNVGDIPGTGLGLAIVKQAVEAHGGTIVMDSTLTLGTTFTITIPLSRRNFSEPVVTSAARG